MVLTHPATVVVYRFSAVGDIVLTSPAIETLSHAWPDTRIIFATKARFAPLLEHNPHIHEVLSLAEKESLWVFRSRLMQQRPEAALDLHGKARSRILNLLVSAPRFEVWQKRPFWHGLAVRLRLARYHASMHITARYHSAVEQLVGRKLDRGLLRLWVGEEERERMSTRLKSLGITGDHPIVGMAPGAMWPTKAWPLERFAALAKRCLGLGASVLLIGSQDDAARADEIAGTARGVINMTGLLDLGQLVALTDHCTAFIANDSGPMHIARALGVPTLTFFGCTDPKQFDFTGHGLMFAGVDCSPCSLYGLRRCPKKHFRCMLDLDLDSTWQTFLPLLDGRRRDYVRG